MEQSDKHSPRIDNAMTDHDRSFLQGSPVDSRVQEHFRDEGPGPRPGQPSADATTADRQPGTSEGLSALQIAQRAELATYIEAKVYPADKEVILESASHLHAPRAVISLIERLPEGTQFGHFQEVWEAIPQ